MAHRVVTFFVAWLVLALAAPAAVRPEVAPQTGWLRVATPHFDIIGPSPADDLRQVGRQLERFRQALERLLPPANVAAARTARIIVFPTDAAYDPFKPQYEGDSRQRVQGHAVGGAGGTYIVLTTEDDRELGVVYHEYVHVLVHATTAGAPAWFDEGLAEFYSTFRLAPGGRAQIGQVLPAHVQLLRRQPLLPLATLFAVDQQSPLYNEADKASMFYAESWALVHYLLLGNGGRYAGQLAGFVARLATGASLDVACSRELKTTPDALARELAQYVAGDAFVEQSIALPEPPVTIGDAVEPVTPGEAHATLGDVLFHMRRLEAAEAQLRTALAADPDQTFAHAVLGQLLAETDRGEEARPHLARAVNGPAATWHTYYAYASVLIDERPPALGSQPGPDDALIEQSLERATELNPSAPEPWGQLAWLKAQNPRTMVEAGRLADEALARAPGDDTLLLLRAQVFVNLRRYDAARPLLVRLARASDPSARQEARELLAKLDALAAATAGRTAEDAGLEVDRRTASGDGVVVFRALQAGERRVAGWLTAVDCNPEGVAILGRAGEGLFRFHAAELADIDLITYSTRRRAVRCGEQFDSTVVVVSYIPDERRSQRLRGKIVALEFPPAGYQPRAGGPPMPLPR